MTLRPSSEQADQQGGFYSSQDADLEGVEGKFFVWTSEERTPVPLLQDRPPLDGRATAYVCQHLACQLPVTTADALKAMLNR